MKSDCFTAELSLIRDKSIRQFITDYLNTLVPDYFYVVPASSSGKYHPEYVLGRGGLVRHTKACVVIGEELLSLEQNLHLNHDKIISALIIHDTFKQGLKQGHTEFEHPVFVARAIVLFAKEYHPEMLEFAIELSELVASHMGQWNTSKYSRVILPKPQTEEQKFIHMCDYLVSRKSIAVDVKYEPSEEEQSK